MTGPYFYTTFKTLKFGFRIRVYDLVFFIFKEVPDTREQHEEYR